MQSVDLSIIYAYGGGLVGLEQVVTSLCDW